jgi:glucosylceramidase
MKKGYIIPAVIALFFIACKPNAPQGSNNASSAELWLTNPDKSALFERQTTPLLFGDSAVQGLTITVSDTPRYQKIDGFGYTLTGGSAIHINGMDPGPRAALLRELFSTDSNGIGISYLRLSIGASDLSDHLFSYNDLPKGETDVDMKKFSLEPERKDLLPVLKEILKINPDIKILGSPWSPPTWMKTNNDTRGGSLKPEYYDAYAKYFVRYIEEMKKEGIRIDAITIQNEPLHPGNNPSLLMLAEEQAAFIKNSLGPAFKAANIDTKIILYDHNADRPDYPLMILNDPEARQYVDGSAFHLYGGSIDTLSKVHDAYPDKHLYFTEQWVGAPGNFAEDVPWHVRTLTIGATRNWCRTVLEWNLSSNPQLTPFTDRGGCSQCLGAVTIDGNNVTRNPAYYSIAHASKFVRPGSVRIESPKNDQLPNVAFSTPAGKRVLIVQNNSGTDQQFNIEYKGKFVTSSLKAGAVGTYVW